jgi:hypothetical protein
MKKLIVMFAASCLLAATTPAFALFTNGGFESGNFDGWTLSGSGTGLSAVIGAGSLQAGQTLAINPYTGTQMARLQDIYGGNHGTTLSQTDTIDSQDKADGGKLYIQWGSLMDNPGHGGGADPYFDITVKINGFVKDTYTADSGAAAASGSGWTNAGTLYSDTLWYKAGQYVYDLSDLNLGDTVQILLHVEDCAWGGHGAVAFLDGVGTVDTGNPNAPVPEPGTMMLLGIGMAGLAVYGKRRNSNKA